MSFSVASPNCFHQSATTTDAPAPASMPRLAGAIGCAVDAMPALLAQPESVSTTHEASAAAIAIRVGKLGRGQRTCARETGSSVGA